MDTNISIKQDRLAALIQCIKNSQASNTDSENKIQNDRNSNFEFRSKSTRQRSRRDTTILNRINQANNSINENRNDEIVKKILKEIDEQSSNFTNKTICHNYNEKKHIINKYFKLKQESFQLNVIRNFRQSIQTNVEKALPIYFIIKTFDESKN